MNGRRKNAPFLDKQNKSPLEEMFILVGSQAWQAWDKGKGLEWHLLCDAVKFDNGEIPVIVGESQLKEINQLNLAPLDKQIVRLCQFGELSQRQISGICANLARFSQVQTLTLCDNLGNLIEDLSPYVARLREDEQSQLLMQQANEQSDKPKNEPYIEYRDNGVLKGLYFVTPKFDKDTHELISEKQQWICDPLELVGSGKNDVGEYFYIFQWQNLDEKTPRIEAVNCGDFGTEAAWKLLKNQGLLMTPRTITQNLVEHFHAQANFAPRWSVTHCTGWHNGAYLLPNGEIIGKPSQPIIFKGKSGMTTGYDTAGTLESWRENIADKVRGNSSMMLALATAFASPLLKFLHADSFGVHLYNRSSKGKTTSLNIANSIYGNPNEIKGSWDTTQAAVTNEASARNDGFITLDELGQAKKIHEVATIAYSLFNEVGRNRGAKEGGNVNLNRWKITALSTGEKDVEGFLQSKGLQINAGQLVRLLNIPLVDVQELHGFTSPKAHADHLNEASKVNYGVVGREWIKLLTQHPERIKVEYARLNALWQNRLAEDCASQVQRVASRFAILETALTLAKELTGWTESENSEALIKSFNDWIAGFGEKEHEESKILNFFNDFLIANAETLFYQIPHSEFDNRPVKDMCGYRILEITGQSKEHFYFLNNAFSRIVSEYLEMPKMMVLETLEKLKMTRNTTPSERKTRPYLHKASRQTLEKGVAKGRYYIIYPYEEEEEENPVNENQ
ncbi:putative DNA primase/helicase [Volucribacter psittacicida]|uniref:Putative DNA primase/helicase n=1 Tax=Volucribacter psittacicida TaxID=203482 RepID=A0A4R1FVS4_9PAST|nr:DUF927 domain-containing protein [Volucribacter psittacicida]TCJ97952.1 putative DNA primase/helicase [Volucribacter psittacicida]